MLYSLPEEKLQEMYDGYVGAGSIDGSTVSFEDFVTSSLEFQLKAMHNHYLSDGTLIQGTEFEDFKTTTYEVLPPGTPDPSHNR